MCNLLLIFNNVLRILCFCKMYNYAVSGCCAYFVFFNLQPFIYSISFEFKAWYYDRKINHADNYKKWKHSISVFCFSDTFSVCNSSDSSLLWNFTKIFTCGRIFNFSFCLVFISDLSLYKSTPKNYQMALSYGAEQERSWKRTKK